VYMLDVPLTKAGALSKAFEAMSDFAGGATLEAAEIDKERGVVLEEWRGRLGASERMLQPQMNALFGGSKYTNRNPIGTPENLKSFPHDRLRAFYRDYYRPDRMAIIVVGDIDPQDVEAQIRANLGALPRVTPAARPPAPIPTHQETRYAIVMDREAQGSSVTVYHKRPKRDLVTVGDYRKSLVQSLMYRMLNARLSEIARQPNAPFIAASSGDDTLGRTLEDERQSVLEESPGATPHLQLQIPLELMSYPWELLHHRGEWLGERFAMGRQVFMQTGLARRVPARRQGCVRPLVIGDPLFDPGVNYRQLPGARNEAEQVAGWFERAARDVGSIIDFNRERDTRIHTRLTGAALRDLLRDGHYDIVHFAGHGVFRGDDRETSAWIVSDGELWALEIRNTLAEHPAPPWLVFANACEAGMDGGRLERHYQGNVFGLATAFINQGVAAYVGPLWPIDDLLAQHIALEFYEQLLSERRTLGEALRRAKVSARAMAYSGQTVDDRQADTAWAGLGWASLVMYGDPTEELFQALAGGSHQTPGQSRQVARAGNAARETGRSGQPAALGRPEPAKPEVPAFAMLHAPDHIVSAWVRGPNWTDAGGEQRGPSSGEIILELIEDAGLRRFLRPSESAQRISPNAHSGCFGK